MQNAAARLLACSRKYVVREHVIRRAAAFCTNCNCQLGRYKCMNKDITTILIDLHWLPIAELIKFKILLLTFKALHEQSPIYIKYLVTRYFPTRSLRSSSALRLNRLTYNLESYGSRAFAVSAPELWNNLPKDIKSCDTIYTFKSKLNTF